MKNSSLKKFVSILLWAYLFAAAVVIQAQQANQGAVTINTDLVVTWAQAVNRTDQSSLKGLGTGDFILREEGKLQKISFVKEGQPLSVVILVDGMTCVRMPEIELQRSREALRQFGEDAEIALMAWDSDVRLVQPLTRDQQLVADKLGDRKSFFIALNGEQKGVFGNRCGMPQDIVVSKPKLFSGAHHDDSD